MSEVGHMILEVDYIGVRSGTHDSRGVIDYIGVRSGIHGSRDILYWCQKWDT